MERNEVETSGMEGKAGNEAVRTVRTRETKMDVRKETYWEQECENSDVLYSNLEIFDFVEAKYNNFIKNQLRCILFRNKECDVVDRKHCNFIKVFL